MKRTEPEASTKDKSTESFVGLSDLLSRATDSYPQERKYILTYARYLFSLVVRIGLFIQTTSGH